MGFYTPLLHYNPTFQRVQQIYAKYKIIEAYNNTQNDLEKVLLGCVDSNTYRYSISKSFNRLGIDTIEKFLHTPLGNILDDIYSEERKYTIGLTGLTLAEQDTYRKIIERCCRKAKKISKENGLSE